MIKHKTVLESIRFYAMAVPNQLAVIDTTTELTYQAYWEKICGVASYLEKLGVEKGEYIILKANQTVDYLVMCHGIQLIGAVCVPLEKSVNEGRVLEIMKETGATKFFGDIIVTGYETMDVGTAYQYEAKRMDFIMPDADADAMILFTTGTTGKSKGIVIQYGAEYAVAENVMYGVEMKPQNVEIIPMPMNHSFSLRRYFANMINGSTVIIIDGVFFVKILFQMIEKYHVTSLAMAPAAMSIIFKLTRDKIGNYAEQLDYIQFGSAPIPEVDKEHLLNILPNVRLYNIYGSTELGCACVLNFNSDDNKPHCIGYPTKNSKFRIIDMNGGEIHNATAEEPGYLSYTGSMKMKEYFQEDELTEQTLVKGYLQSNDLGYQDEKGRIYMLGRADDVIISGGNKVSPLEVEEAAKQYEGVSDCICKSRFDAIVGAVPILYIVSREEINLSGLEEHLMNLLEDFKRPRAIMRIESVPRTYNGKIDRKAEIQ
ncbi:MAG: class I adenylate-forming enzyme family protein [Eubacteriales bacterium]